MAVTPIEGQVNLSGATTPTFTNSISGNGGAGSDLIIAFGIGSTAGGFTDNFNTGGYTLLPAVVGNAYSGGGATQILIGYKICNAGTNVGAGTFAVAGSGGMARIQAMHFNGFVHTAQFPTGDIAQAVSIGSNANLNSGSFNASFNNEYIVAWVIDNSGFSNPISGLWLSSVFPQGVQLNCSVLAANPVSAGTACSVVVTANDGSNPWVAQCFGFYDGLPPVTPVYGDGSSSGATSAATGTNGTAMPAIVAGNQLDVIVHITNSTVPTAMTISDGHNTYNAGAGQFGSIDVFNDSGNGQIWYRFRCSVTVPLTTPVITATAQAGYFPTNMSIFAGILTGIATGNPTAPLTAANVAHSSVISGPNQISGFTPVLAAGPGINYTASAFAMDVGASFPVAAPTAGNNFTQIATAWAFISSGGTTPTLLWETMVISSGGAATQATAVYQSGRPYTLLAVFNNLAGAINPAGPMPRQLYIMP